MTWDLFLNTPISPRFFYILYIFLHKRKRSHHTFFTLLYIFIEWHSETFLSALSPILVYESRHLYSVCVYLSNLCYLCIFIFMNLFAKTTQLSATSIAIWIHPFTWFTFITAIKTILITMSVPSCQNVSLSDHH